MLKEFFESYSAPDCPKSTNGMISPNSSADYVISKLSGYVSKNDINMSNYFNTYGNLLFVGSQVSDLFTSLRPNNFSSLHEDQKNKIDTSIWSQASFIYSDILLGGETLFDSDKDHLAGIIMNYCDSFYYDDTTGKTIRGHAISDYKWKLNY
jgi:hypothetical protein